MKFVDLPLSDPILKAVNGEGYTTATPIQARTIPHTIDGRDILGCAQTGTGKTAAFALPLLHRLLSQDAAPRSRQPRVLVLAPTRELTEQIHQSFRTYGRHTPLRSTVVYGGVGQGPQVKALRRGVHILAATPGRLLDLIQQGHCDLSATEVLVLDEADRMLDMGFMPDIKKIIAPLPKRRQTLLFSATMPQAIRQLAGSLLRDPAEVTVKSESPAVERIAQSVYHVARSEKTTLLKQLLETHPISRAIVFTRTKHGADRVARQMKRSGVGAEAIHGDKSQGARRHALNRFRNGQAPVLVATDIAARGIDVEGISHVVNYDIARDPESHVHRIGRTAR
ncbi:MAG: DEAD/DEAH box helicase, partial [Phycisphaeraceae bacterium]|nr:DEAD/DEAH box helicase [Phycisphaeraceae bacterium]